MIFFKSLQNTTNFFPISALSSKKWLNFLCWELFNMINCFFLFNQFGSLNFFHWLYGGIEDKKNIFWDFLTFRDMFFLVFSPKVTWSTVCSLRSILKVQSFFCPIVPSLFYEIFFFNWFFSHFFWIRDMIKRLVTSIYF